MRVAVLIFLLISVSSVMLFVLWQIFVMCRKLWDKPFLLRHPRAWVGAAVLSFVWLPAWYSFLATASHRERYNPEISRLNTVLFYWLLAAVVVQIIIACLLLWRQYRQKQPLPSGCSAIFILTGLFAIFSSCWLMPLLYTPLFSWWWEPLLNLFGLTRPETFKGLRHTDFSPLTIFAYIFFGNIPCLTAGGIWAALTLHMAHRAEAAASVRA